MTAVTPTDRPKSVQNRCVIQVFGGVFYVVTLLFYISVDVGDFVIGLSQNSSFCIVASYNVLKPNMLQKVEQ